ncbi:hypothetical protein COP2_044632 [Malus domestica]
MTMEWCLQQERSDLFWKNLYKQQGKELRQLKAINLNAKMHLRRNKRCGWVNLLPLTCVEVIHESSMQRF